MRLYLALVAAFLTLLLRPAPADACSQPWPLPPRGSVTATRDGLLSIALGEAYPASYYRLEVATGDGVPVEGTAEYVGHYLVWRPAQPLVPGAYRARLFIELSPRKLEDEIAVVVVDAEAPEAGAPAVEWIRGGEAEVPAEQLCCDQERDSCGDLFWRHCWAQTYDYPVDVTVVWSPSPEAQRNAVLYAVVPRDGGPPRPAIRGGTVRFPARTAEYCVEIETRDLIHGTVLRTPVCTRDLREIERSGPETPDPAVCDGAVVDEATGVPVGGGGGGGGGGDGGGGDGDGAGGDGCAAGGQPSSALILIAAAFMLVRLRRR